MNFDKAHPIQHAIFENNDSYYLESDSDAQLIINLGFTCPVKIHHLVLRAFNDKSQPTIMKLFVNTKPLGFSECENDEATQEFELKEKDFKEDIVLKFVKFQAVKSLTIFFGENQGADKTKIIKFGLFGSSEKETDVINRMNLIFIYYLDEKS